MVPGRDPQAELGPNEQDFIAAYSSVAGAWPDYPAVQAAAGAVLATGCAEIAGSVRPDALWAAATNLQTTTLFGPFGIDRVTGAQRSQTPVLTCWRGGEQRLVR